MFYAKTLTQTRIFTELQKQVSRTKRSSSASTYSSRDEGKVEENGAENGADIDKMLDGPVCHSGFKRLN